MNTSDKQPDSVSTVSQYDQLPGQVTIFTDGASRGNPGRGGYGAVVIYPNAKQQYKIDEIGGFESVTTNNRMELTAVAAALESMVDFYDTSAIEGVVGMGKKITFCIYTDSSYVLNGINTWIHGWKRNNWLSASKEPIKNEDLWRRLDRAVEVLGALPIKLVWNLLPGHAGVPGNERADKIATSYADKENAADTEMYHGYSSDYPYRDVLNVLSKQSIDSARTEKHTKSKSDKKTGNAYSYVSLVNDVLSVDKTWAECESRVKGQSGARFKKAYSKEDEELIKKEFTQI